MAYPHPRRLAAVTLALAAATCAGCTIYASDHEGDWDDDWDRRPSARVRSDSGGALRSASAVSGSPGGGIVAVGLMGRPVRVLVEAEQMEGTLREMGDWILLEREDGSSVYIPRERIRYIELRDAATTQP